MFLRDTGLATTQTHLQSSRGTIAFASIIWASSIFLSRIIGLRAAQTVHQPQYALGSTWQPTAVGTAVAFCAVPLYILLRQQYGAMQAHGLPDLVGAISPISR